MAWLKHLKNLDKPTYVLIGIIGNAVVGAASAVFLPDHQIAIPLVLTIWNAVYMWLGTESNQKHEEESEEETEQ